MIKKNLFLSFSAFYFLGILFLVLAFLNPTPAYAADTVVQSLSSNSFRISGSFNPNTITQPHSEAWFRVYRDYNGTQTPLGYYQGIGNDLDDLNLVPGDYGYQVQYYGTHPTTPGYSQTSEGYTYVTVYQYRTVTGSAGLGGSIAVTPQTIVEGNTTTMTATPNSGYIVDTVSGCGGVPYTNPSALTTPYLYTTGAITANCTVNASFKTVSNPAPAVNAGADRTVTSPTNSSSSLNATATDANGISSTTWSFISGPNASANISSPNSLNTNFTALTVPGVYTFRLTAVDNGSPQASAYDEMTVTVNPAGMSGYINSGSSSCIIPDYASTCNIIFDWRTTNPVGVSGVTRNPSSGFTQIDQNTGLQWPLYVTNGSNTFFLYNSGTPLDQETVSASCEVGSSWVNGLCEPVSVPPAGTDLIAFAVTPTTYSFPFTPPLVFSATIKNNGGTSTGGTAFYNVLNYSDAIDGTGTRSDVVRTQVFSALGAGATTNLSFNFAAPLNTPYSLRVCADQYYYDNMNAGGGNVITESDNNNNCGPWTNIYPVPPPTYTITPSAGPGGTISPNTAQTSSPGGTRNFTISANGASGYSIQTPIGGTCPGSMTTATNYSAGPIDSDCSVSVTFRSMSGTLTPAAYSCTIPSGGSSCNINFTWSTLYPIGISAVTSDKNNSGASSPNFSVASGNTGGPTAFIIPYGGRTFYLHNNAVLLDTENTVSSVCFTGTSWNGTSCATNALPTLTLPVHSSVTSNSATMGATVTSLGVPNVISARGICYGTSPNPTLANAICTPPASGLTTGPFTQNKTGLNTNATYYYAGYATNAFGTGYSPQSSFTTTSLLMTGTLTSSAASCNIANNASSCNVNLTWTTTNPQGTSGVTSDKNNSGVLTPNFSVATGNNSPAPTAVPIPYGSRRFDLYNNSSWLNNPGLTITAACTGGTGWNSATSTCQNTAAPSVTLPTHTAITSTGATLGATVASLGIPNSITERGTCWATTTNPTTNCLPESATSATGAFSHARTGMPSNTLIYYRGYVDHPVSGRVYSTNGSFTTTATATAPTLTTSAASSITSTTATGGGTIVSDGGSTITVSGIVWSTSPNPTTVLSTKTTDGWATGGPWVSNMTGLTANTLYYVRAYATNGVGTSYGAPVQFTTTNSSGPSGTISVVGCSIAANASTCSASVTWSTSNLTANPTEVTRNNPNNTSVSFLTSSTNFPNTVNYGPSTFFLYHNSSLLATSNIITADCVANHYWNNTSCVPNAPTAPNVTLSATPPSIIPPATSTLQWSSSNADSCTSTDFNTGGATSGSVVVAPVVNTKYSIACVNNASGIITPAEVWVMIGSAGPKIPGYKEN